MFKNKITILGIIIILIFSCSAMYFIDVYSNLNYFSKSFFKIILFGILPCLYCYIDRNISLKDYFKIGCKKQLLYSLLLGLSVYLIIIIAYLVVRNFIDLKSISNTLSEDLNVGKDNFIYVALYISFINSLLEEFFFRGFIFLSLNKLSNRSSAYILSSLSFSLYHIAIILGWFNIYLFVFILFALLIAGLLFNYLNDKNNNIYNSWLVHMFANFAINSIGIIMFYF